MRLLHVSDFHFQQQWFEWLSTVAPSYDVVCLTGDLLDLRQSEQAPLPAQIAWVTQWLRAFPPVPLWVCTGNHDWWQAERPADPYAEGRWLKPVRHARLQVDGPPKVLHGRRFVTVPWLESPPDIQSPEPVVLLAHAPPAGTQVARNHDGEDHGDFEVALQAEMLPPGSAVLSGHVHRPQSWMARLGSTWCFSPGVAAVREPRPNHIVIDTSRKVAEFHSARRPVVRRRL